MSSPQLTNQSGGPSGRAVNAHKGKVHPPRARHAVVPVDLDDQEPVESDDSGSLKPKASGDMRTTVQDAPMPPVGTVLAETGVTPPQSPRPKDGPDGPGKPGQDWHCADCGAFNLGRDYELGYCWDCRKDFAPEDRLHQPPPKKRRGGRGRGSQAAGQAATGSAGAGGAEEPASEVALSAGPGRTQAPSKDLKSLF